MSTEEEVVEATSDDEEDVSEDDTERSGDDTLYLYRIPLEVNDGVKEATYSVNSDGKGYLSYYGANQHVVITETASGHLHRDNVNAQVEELTRAEVEESEDLVSDFVRGG